MDIKIKWINQNTIPTQIKIYRGEQPLDRAALGIPLITLTNGETEWIDATAEYGKIYYYVLEAVSAHDQISTINYKIEAVPRRGHGPNTLQRGSYEYGYFGTFSSSDIVAADDLNLLLGLTVATGPFTLCKICVGGKVCFFPTTVMGSLISFQTAYNAGLVYGTDDQSKIPQHVINTYGFVNQKKVVQIGDDEFLFRVCNSNDDLSLNAAGGEFDKIQAPMFTGDRLVPEIPVMGDFTAGAAMATQLTQNISGSSMVNRGINSIALSAFTNSVRYIPLIELVM